jgi:hypothetical protein
MESSVGALPASLACTESQSRCCRPQPDLDARLHWKRQASVWSYAQICTPFSCSAEVGFAVWEFRDLGSGVKVVDRQLGSPPHPPSIFLDCAAPGANVVNRSLGDWGVGLNLTIAVLRGSGSGSDATLSCARSVAHQ